MLRCEPDWSDAVASMQRIQRNTQAMLVTGGSTGPTLQPLVFLVTWNDVVFGVQLA